MTLGVTWTPELIDLLHRFVDEKMTVTQIAAAMPVHMTRNAVVGKMHRLGLHGKSGHGGGYTKAHVNRKPKAKRPHNTLFPVNVTRQRSRSPEAYRPKVVCAPGPEGGVSFMDREDHQCAWPLDNGNYCGAGKISPRHSYCDVHDAHGHQSRETKEQARLDRAERQKQNRFKGYGT